MLGLSNGQLHQSKNRPMKRAMRGKAALIVAAPTSMQRDKFSFSGNGTTTAAIRAG
jgi:hypothetical protein